MSTELDPTQQGGPEATPEPRPADNPRNALEAQIAAQVHEQAAQDLAGFNEETGQIEATPEAPKADPVADPAPATDAQPTDPADPVPEKPRMLTIIVDGKPIEVEESKALEAGKRTLQKDNAADRRLQEAARKLQEADAAQKRVEAQAAYIRQIAEQNGIHLQAPSQDAPPQQQATPGLDRQALAAFVKEQFYNSTAEQAAAKFFSDFPEIASDPYLRQMAAHLEDQRMATATALGEPLGDPHLHYRKHGETIREWLKQRTAPTAPAAPIADKAERKRTITAITAVNARSQAPEEKRPPTASEIIEAERLSRTQARRGYQRLS